MSKRLTRKDTERAAVTMADLMKLPKELEEQLVTEVIRRIMPSLDRCFDEQNKYMQHVVNKTMEDGYKLILKYSIEEREEALAEVEDWDAVGLSEDDGGHESESDKTFNDEHEKKAKEDDDE